MAARNLDAKRSESRFRAAYFQLAFFPRTRWKNVEGSPSRNLKRAGESQKRREILP